MIIIIIIIITIVHVTGNCKANKTILFRIPSWTNGRATILVNGVNELVKSGIMIPVNCNGVIDVLLTLPMTIRIQRRYNNGISIYNGCGLLLMGVANSYY